MSKYKELTKEQIENINMRCPKDQGVFVQPYGIPVHIKGPVVYGRYETGGYSGGSCFDEGDECAQPYYCDAPSDRMKVLDIVMAVLRPKITPLERRMLLGLIRDNSETEWEYYGNCTDWKIEYIELSELYRALEKFDKK